MNFQAFVERFKNQGASLHVTDLAIATDDGIYLGNGKLLVRDEEATLEATLQGNQPLPQRKSGTFDLKDAWLITGFVEDELPFWTTSWPQSWSERNSRSSIFSSEFDIDRVHHVPTACDAAELRDMSVLAWSETGNPIAATRAEARLRDFKIMACNDFTTVTTDNAFFGQSQTTKRNTVTGRISRFEFGLRQDEDDCLVCLRTLEGESADVGEIQEMFQVLLEAIAFAHGRNAWPYWQTITGERLIEWANPGRRSPRGNFPAATGATCVHSNALVGIIESFVSMACSKSEFSLEIRRLMYLAREAGAKTTPFDTALLGLCVTFERAAKVIAAQILSESPASNSKVHFESSKQQIQEFIDTLVSNTMDAESMNALQRFKRIVGSADYGHRTDVFLDLARYLGIPSERAGIAYEAWKSERHPRAHGRARDISKEALLNKSRIAGALNTLFCAAIGFKGPVPLSLYEDCYVTL